MRLLTSSLVFACATSVGLSFCPKGSNVAPGQDPNAVAVVVNPSEASRKYSSVWGGNAIGTGHARSMLDSDQAWSAQSNDGNQWAQVDLGRTMSVSRVLTQARSNKNCCEDQRVTAYAVKVSTDGSSWQDVDSGKTFIANLPGTNFDLQVPGIFSKPVQARYVKVFVVGWSGHISMRFGVVSGVDATCVACQAGQYAPGPSSLSTMNPAESARRYSSVWGGNAIGTGHARSMLDSDQAWSAQSNDGNQWAQIDLGNSVIVTGVITQARSDRNCCQDQRVTGFKVRVSDDLTTWQNVDDGSVFSANTPDINFNTKVVNSFVRPVRARYVRLLVTSWSSHISMRFGVQTGVVATTCASCSDGQYVVTKYLVDPPEGTRTYSSVWNNETPGTGHARSMLDSPQAWSAAVNDGNQWAQLDLGITLPVSAVVMQARNGVDQRVTAYTVKTSVDGANWEDVYKSMPEPSTTGENKFKASTVKFLNSPDGKAATVFCMSLGVDNFPTIFRGCVEDMEVTKSKTIAKDAALTALQVEQAKNDKTTSKTLSGRTCIATGDPHFINYNGVGYFHLQRPGVFILARNLEKSFEVQERMALHSTNIACLRGVAVRYRSDIIEIPNVDNKRDMWVNGKQISYTGQTVVTPNQGLTVSGGMITALNGFAVWMPGGYCSEVKINLPSRFVGQMEGICGNGSGSPSAADYKNKAGQQMNVNYGGSDWSSGGYWGPNSLLSLWQREWHPYGWECMFRDGCTDGLDVWPADPPKNTFPTIAVGSEFIGNAAGAPFEQKFKGMFVAPVLARYVRVSVVKWINHISMRFGVETSGYSTGCASCVAGTFGSKGVCVACAAGKYTSTSSATSCSSCDSGKIAQVPTLLNPPEASRSYSSVWGGNAIGTGHARSMLDSDQAWSAQSNDGNQWAQVDLGVAMPVTGIVTQARSNKNCCEDQRVTAFTVKVSLDGNDWVNVENAKQFAANPAGLPFDTKVSSAFVAPVTARFVRVAVSSWSGHISMRFGVSVGTSTMCTACPVGTFGSNGKCAACSTGQFAANAGSTSCSSCPGGKYALASSVSNPPETSRTYSSVWGGNAIGTGHARSMLDSDQAWSAQSNDGNQWAQIDLGSVLSVTRVITQARSNKNCCEDQRVTAYTVKVSTDGSNWKDVDGGKKFTGNPAAMYFDVKATGAFSAPVDARFVRLNVASWSGHISMRFGVETLGASSCAECAAGTYLQSNKCTACVAGMFSAKAASFCTNCNAGEYSANVSNPPEVSRSYSSVWGSNAIGTGHARSMLDSDQAWSAQSNDGNQWAQIDFGFVVPVMAVFMQARSSKNCCQDQRVTKYMVKVSTDGLSWTDVDKGASFVGNPPEMPFDMYSVGTFLAPAQARYLRVMVISWSGHISMRFGAKLAGGSASCAACAPGTISNTKASFCENCAPGKFSTNKTTCSVCSAGTFTGPTNLPESERSYSSVWSGEAIGTGHARSMLDSVQAWSAASNNAGQWAQVDLGRVRPVSSVTTQARSNKSCCENQRVTSYSVKFSADGSTWKDVDGGKVFAAQTPSMNFDEKVTNTFSAPVDARFVRIVVATWSGHISMRFGVGAGGAASCDSCPAGKSSIAGSASCTTSPCAAGSFKASTATTCSPCSAGKFAALGGSACTDCSAGQFSAAAAGSCTACPLGQFGAAAVASSCTSCSAGKYQKATGQKACDQCASGTASSTVGATSNTCIACAAGSIAASTGASSCTVCPKGSYQNGKGTSSCTKCSAGQFQSATGASNGCSTCAAGTFQGAQGSESCATCTAGKSAAAAAASCLPCAAGSFSSKEAAPACTSCAVGTIATAAGATSCTSCAAGTYKSTTSGTQCVNCEAGRFASNTGSSTCANCATGTISAAKSSVCSSCAVGTYKDTTGGTQCVDCIAGQFASVAGSVKCTVCDAGKIAATGKASSCAACPVSNGASSSKVGQSSCSTDICAAGFYMLSGKCSACIAGTISAAGATKCTDCKAGTYQTAQGSSTCFNCSAGMFKAEAGRGSCSSCAVGTYSLAMSGLCTKCPTGTYQSSSNQTTCSNCSAGKFQSATGTASCSPCQAGTYSAANASVCPACSAGKFTNTASATACANCTQGQYSANGAIACMGCSAGTYQSATGSASCLSCEAGKYESSSASAGCKGCAAGSSSVAGSKQCTGCEPGTFAAAAGPKCSACPAGTFTSMPFSATCANCAGGMYMASAGNLVDSCSACSAGKFSDAGASTCSGCPAGKYAGPRMSNCTNCAAGTFQAESGAPDSCKYCTYGMFAATAGKVSCDKCAAGFYAATTGAVQCSGCSMGNYQPLTAQSSCINCPLGKFQNVMSSTGCKDCSAGTFKATAGSADPCSTCDSAKFALTTGASQCDSCSTGQYSPGKTSACLPCAAGSFAEPTKCTACAAGKYSAAKVSSCTSCATGTFKATTGGTTCTTCSAGTYATGTGSSACANCATGSYSAAGAASCTGCGTGYQTNAVGSSSCSPSQCGGGQYKLTSGLCGQCIAGTYSPGGLVTQCTNCAIGTYQTGVKGSTCFNCSAGTFKGVAGAGSCFTCAGGSYSVAGAKECTNCAAGSFQAAAGMSNCVACTAGQYNKGEFIPPTPDIKDQNLFKASTKAYLATPAGKDASFFCTSTLQLSGAVLKGCLEDMEATGSKDVARNSALASTDAATKDQTSSGRTCVATGDPHFTNYNGDYFHPQRPGIFTLARSSDLSFEVQEAMKSIQDRVPAISCLTGVAVRYGTVKLEFPDVATPSRMFLNGVEKSLNGNTQTFGGVKVYYSGNIVVTTPNGFTVTVAPGFCNTVYVSLPRAYAGKMQGLCGSGSGVASANDYFDKAGQVMNVQRGSGGWDTAGYYSPTSGMSLWQKAWRPYAYDCLFRDGCSPDRFYLNSNSPRDDYPNDPPQGLPPAALSPTQTTTGSSMCLSCAAGTVSAAGQSSCVSCAAGKFKDVTGGSQCALCAAGKYASSTGASTCVACAAGTFSSAGVGSCTKCPSWASSSAGSDVCKTVVCPPGSFITTQVVNPPETSRKYSSVWSGEAIGTGHARSMLNSAQAWSAQSNDKNQWAQVDLGTTMPVTAVLVQSRNSVDQRVSAYTLQSSIDGSTWSNVLQMPPPANTKGANSFKASTLNWLQSPAGRAADAFCQTLGIMSFATVYKGCLEDLETTGKQDIARQGALAGLAREKEATLAAADKSSNNSLSGRTCIATGDPHFVNYNGVGYFHLQRSGVFVLARNTEKSFEVQERMAYHSNNISCLRGVAVRYRTDTIEIPNVDNQRDMWVNGKQISYNGGTLVAPNGGLTVTGYGGTITALNGFAVSGYGGYCSTVQVNLPSRFVGKMEGLCGNGSGSPSAADYKNKAGQQMNVNYGGSDWSSGGYWGPNSLLSLWQREWHAYGWECMYHDGCKDGQDAWPADPPKDTFPMDPIPGSQFAGNAAGSPFDAIVKGVFAAPVEARYLRLNVVSWINHISMRFAVETKIGFLPCAAGKFTAFEEMLACADCLAGTYQSSTGRTTCLNCGAGSVSQAAGAVSCDKCVAGKYVATNSQAYCLDCAMGQYTNATGKTVCDICAAGQFAGNTASSGCTACAKGTSSSAGANVCPACAAGTFRDTVGGTQCISCAAGTFASATGSAACVVCSAGFIAASAGAKSCVACPSGTYKNTSGGTQCINCPAGQFNSATGVSTNGCTACAAGKFSGAAGAKECPSCPSNGGSFISVGQSSCSPDVCNAGLYKLNGKCNACAAGTFSAAAATQCTNCPVGTFQAAPGASSCGNCSAGTYKSSTGAGACSNCSAGTISVAKSSSCTGCKVGTYQGSAGQTSCLNCSAGKVATSANATSCANCAAGFYSSAAASACSACAAGTFQNAAGSSVCSACASGKYAAGTAVTSCSSCSTGTVSDAGKNACTSCAVGKFKDTTGGTQCANCPAGQYSSATGKASCTVCPSGTYAFAISGSCTNCALFTTSSAGAADCKVVNCNAGTYKGPTSCLNCAAGKSSASANLTSCTDCKAGSFTAATGQASCSNCSAGLYKSNAGAGACSKCGAGTYAGIANSAGCTFCAAGRFQNELGATACYQCAAGTFQKNSGATSCTACTAGSISPTPGNSSDCTKCAAGSFKAEVGGTQCVTCVAGKAAPSAGSASCASCLAGSYANAGAALCTNCAAGMESTKVGASSCTASLCPAGKFKEVSGKCTDCIAGTYSGGQLATSCTPCAVGKFQSAKAASVCSACSAGQFQSTTGKMGCSSCAVGTYSEGGASACVNCAIGSAQPLAGMSLCVNCVAGTFAGSSGSANCLPCTGGVYSAAKASSCSKCSAGLYQPNNAQTSCMQCGSGFFQTDVGQTGCTGCSAGKFTDTNGASVCSACAAGRYSSTPNSKTCVSCAVGTYSSAASSTSCVSCASGVSNSATGSTSCTNLRCQAGYYSTNVAAGVEYTKINSNMDWNTCKNSCVQRGLTIARIYSAAENAKATRAVGDGAWIGFNTISTGRTFVWEGAPNPRDVPFTSWSPGEPNNWGGNEPCTQLYNNGNWNDNNCGAQMPCLCQSTTTAATCVACVPGKYSHAGSTVCTDCPAGTAQHKSAESSCPTCAVGTQQPLSGQTVCVKKSMFFAAAEAMAQSSTVELAVGAVAALAVVGTVLAGVVVGFRKLTAPAASEEEIQPLMTKA